MNSSKPSESNVRQLKSEENSFQLSGKKEIFRQQRVDNHLRHLSLEIGGSQYDLINWSRTGIAFLVPEEERSFKVGLKIGPCRVCVDDMEVYSGDIEIKTFRPTSGGSLTVGAEFATQMLPMEGVSAAQVVSQCLADVKNVHSDIEAIEARFCQLVMELITGLQFVRSYCQEMEGRLLSLTYDERSEALATFLPHMSQRVSSLVNDFNTRIAEVVDVETVSEESIYHKLFETHVFPFFQTADVARRAHEKPLGYAGDFEMMNQIYRDGYEGGDLFGQIINSVLTKQDAADAVRYRRPFFKNVIETVVPQDSEGGKNILSVACGPAVEIQEILREWTNERLSKAHFVLFDLDGMALSHAQTKLHQLAMDLSKEPSLEFVNSSVRSLLYKDSALEEQFDCIYSGGLFDYIDNRTSRVLVERMFSMLRQNGRLIIGNFTKENATKPILHLLLKWHLIHKTEQDMYQWAEGLSEANVSIAYDPSGINAFLVIRKQ